MSSKFVKLAAAGVLSLCTAASALAGSVTNRAKPWVSRSALHFLRVSTSSIPEIGAGEVILPIRQSASTSR